MPMDGHEHRALCLVNFGGGNLVSSEKEIGPIDEFLLFKTYQNVEKGKNWWVYAYY